MPFKFADDTKIENRLGGNDSKSCSDILLVLELSTSRHRCGAAYRRLRHRRKRDVTADARTADNALWQLDSSSLLLLIVLAAVKPNILMCFKCLLFSLFLWFYGFSFPWVLLLFIYLSCCNFTRFLYYIVRFIPEIKTKSKLVVVSCNSVRWSLTYRRQINGEEKYM